MTQTEITETINNLTCEQQKDFLYSLLTTLDVHDVADVFLLQSPDEVIELIDLLVQDLEKE